MYNSTFSHSSKGDYFYIGDNCTITGATFIGHDASPTLFLNELITEKHVWMTASRRSYRSPIHIGNNVFIGVGCIILPSVHIGNNVVIAAGSVITKDIEDNSVYAGNPAKK
ncbi:DapH/DapD/GlmU-related protein [Providencia rettgeri]